MEQHRLRGTRIRRWVKPLGAVALLSFLIATPFSFEPRWFLFALFVWIGSLLMYAWVATLFHYPATGTPARAKPRPRERWLVAAEDGVFLLPLVFIGASFLTALVAAVLYALYQRHERPAGYVVVRGAACFTVGLLVVPQGVWIAVLAHAVSELIAARYFPDVAEQVALEEEQRPS